MRIAIVKLSALGDIVHSLIVLQFIKNLNKETLIDWFVDSEYKELLENNEDINQIHTINLKKALKSASIFSVISELVKLRKLASYDLVIDMQGLIKSGLIAKLIPSNKTIGFDRHSIREKLASFFYSHKFNSPYSKNIIERNISLVGFALGFIVSRKQIDQKQSFLFPKQKKIDTKNSKTKKNIILVAGASHISKCFPVHKFAQLSELLEENFIVIWGNENEKSMARQIKKLSPKVIICKKLSINSLINLISMADLVIGGDTGPTHLAWALNVPSITLFGPTPGYRNAFETSINRIIESNSIVNPYKIDKSDNSIKDIDIQEILKVSKELLEIK